jgi:hypothetical protein
MPSTNDEKQSAPETYVGRVVREFNDLWATFRKNWIVGTLVVIVGTLIISGSCVLGAYKLGLLPLPTPKLVDRTIESPAPIPSNPVSTDKPPAPHPSSPVERSKSAASRVTYQVDENKSPAPRPSSPINESKSPALRPLSAGEVRFDVSGEFQYGHVIVPGSWVVVDTRDGRQIDAKITIMDDGGGNEEFRGSAPYQYQSTWRWKGLGSSEGTLEVKGDSRGQGSFVQYPGGVLSSVAYTYGVQIDHSSNIQLTPTAKP